MIELVFARDLYSGFAVDSAVNAYAEFADCQLEERPDAWVVSLTSSGEHDERTIADELANYALGATIEEQKPVL
jgi:hypothetical protein